MCTSQEPMKKEVSLKNSQYKTISYSQNSVLNSLTNYACMLFPKLCWHNNRHVVILSRSALQEGLKKEYV